MAKNRDWIGLIAAVLLLAGGGLALSMSGAQFSLGGVVTSLSYVNIQSNYAGINGPAWLASIVLNGKYQNLTGFSAKTLNSSLPTGTPVSITTSVTKQGYKFTYSQSPTLNLYTYTVTPIAGIKSGYTCSLGIACQENINGNLDVWGAVWIPSGSGTATAIEHGFEQAYWVKCNAAGGTTILVTLANLGVGGGTDGGALECVLVGSNHFAAIYQDNTFTDIYNATVSVTNGTKTYNININNNQPDGNVTGQVYVIGEGITASGYNINQQNIPSVLYNYGTGKYVLVNPISVLSTITGPTSPSVPSGTMTPYYQFASPSGQATVYSNQTLSNIANLNSQIQQYTYAPNTAPYSQLNIAAFSSSNPVATLNLSATPTFYTNIQVIAKYQTLGVGIPVATPVITSISPSNPDFASSSTQQIIFNVQNTGSAAGSVYVTGACNNNAFSSSTSPVGVSAGSTGQIAVQVTAPINTQSTKASYTCSANAHSVGNIYTSPTFTFGLQVNAACSQGYYYVNASGNCAPIQPQISTTSICTSGNQNCGGGSTTTIGTSCRTGFTLINNTCVQNAGCPTGYQLNMSVTPNLCQPIVGPGSGLTNLDIIIIAVVAVGAVAAIVIFGKKKKRIRVRMRT